MKKGRLFMAVVVAIILVAEPLAAQEGSASGQAGSLEFGVKGGLSLASFFWTGDLGWNSSTMFAFMPEAFAFARVGLSDGFGIQLDAGYHGNGCSVDASDGYAHWYMHYLELPIWARWNTGDDDFNLYAGVGAYLAWFLGGSYDIATGYADFDGSGSLTQGTIGQVDVVRAMDYGVLFVLGVETGRTIYELRFPIGIVTAIEFTPPLDFGGTRGVLNSGFDIIVGYRF